MGIRLALGAQPGSVLSMILCETLALTVIGIAVGIPCAMVAARLIAHLLFNVTPYDPVTLALVPVVLLAVGALASYIPARRAMKVDPLVALRHEGLTALFRHLTIQAGFSPPWQRLAERKPRCCLEHWNTVTG